MGIKLLAIDGPLRGQEIDFIQPCHSKLRVGEWVRVVKLPDYILSNYVEEHTYVVVMAGPHKVCRLSSSVNHQANECPSSECTSPEYLGGLDAATKDSPGVSAVPRPDYIERLILSRLKPLLWAVKEDLVIKDGRVFYKNVEIYKGA